MIKQNLKNRFIPYIGNKSKFSDFIVPYIPTDISTYVEPFGGMYGIFFSLDFNKFNNVKFIYNDINILNSNLFKVLKEDDNFVDLVYKVKISEDRYKDAINSLNNTSSNIELAINWLIVLTCSSPYKLDSWRGVSYFELFKIWIYKYLEKIKKIDNIHNIDYKDIVNIYDSSSTFFYLDPPYKGKESYYIRCNFGEKDHEELSKILNNIKGRFILSYYYFNGLEDLYKGMIIKYKKTIMGTEYIIMNY